MTDSTDLCALELATRMSHLHNLGPIDVVTPLKGGRNNRAFHVVGSLGTWVLKRYFQSDAGRDRCGSEWQWLTFCQRHKVACVPEPIAHDAHHHASLLQYISGRHLRADEVNEEHVAQAAAFANDVNQHRVAKDSNEIPMAAEACFSINAHVACVEGRIQRLRGLPITDDLDRRLEEWLSNELEPTWRRVTAKVNASMTEEQRLRKLDPSERCLSPSDFGFHNALLTPMNDLRFLDFEYAGWDDPAKLICDFYWQPAIPAPRATRPLLLDALSQSVSRAELDDRANLLWPVYGVKWCCLVLNEFLSEDRRRREFAQSAAVTADRRAAQLRIAQRILIETNNSLS